MRVRFHAMRRGPKRLKSLAAASACLSTRSPVAPCCLSTTPHPPPETARLLWQRHYGPAAGAHGPRHQPRPEHLRRDTACWLHRCTCPAPGMGAPRRQGHHSAPAGGPPWQQNAAKLRAGSCLTTAKRAPLRPPPLRGRGHGPRLCSRLAQQAVPCGTAAAAAAQALSTFLRPIVALDSRKVLQHRGHAAWGGPGSRGGPKVALGFVRQSPQRASRGEQVQVPRPNHAQALKSNGGYLN